MSVLVVAQLSSEIPEGLTNNPVFNIMCFCFWISAVISEGIQTSFMFATYFYSLHNPIILVFQNVGNLFP